MLAAGCDTEVHFFSPGLRFHHGSAFDDSHEPNDSAATASLLDTGMMVGDVVIVRDLAGFDDDWFEIRTGEASDIIVRLTQDIFFGDMDLRVFDASGTLLGSTTTASDTETVTVTNVPAGTYFILAEPWATQEFYDLRIDIATPTPKPSQLPVFPGSDQPSE